MHLKGEEERRVKLRRSPGQLSGCRSGVQVACTVAVPPSWLLVGRRPFG